jgi:hypothetical protein
MATILATPKQQFWSWDQEEVMGLMTKIKNFEKINTFTVYERCLMLASFFPNGFSV